MAGDEGEVPPPGEGELARDRCPSCGSLLTFQEGRAEGYCAVEEIYVEILKPVPPEPSRPPLVRTKVLNATKRELHDLCRAYGLRVSGNKTDLLTRLLRYMDDHKIDLPPEELEEAGEPPAAAPEAPVEAVSPEGEAELTPPEAVPPMPEPARAEAAGVPEAEAAPVDELLADIEGEATLPEMPPEPTPATAAEEEVSLPDVVEAALQRQARLRRDRRIFYVGAALAALGGPGLIFGSFLHDAFRVPVVGRAYEAFGELNVTAALIGGILLLAGLVAIGFGLRGGVVRAKPSGV